MSNDLISRNALLNHLRGNVLVDVTSNLEKAIADEPVAYDEEKVVDQITKAKDAGGLVYYVDGRPVIYKGQAIEIIRAGGRQQSCEKE